MGITLKDKKDCYYDALSMGIFAVYTNNGTFKDLNTELITFLNLLRNTHGVARTHVDDGFLLLGISHLLQ